MSRKKRKLNSKEQETRAANQNIELIQEDEIVEEQETMEQQERQELIEEQEPVQDAPAQQLELYRQIPWLQAIFLQTDIF